MMITPRQTWLPQLTPAIDQGTAGRKLQVNVSGTNLPGVVVMLTTWFSSVAAWAARDDTDFTDALVADAQNMAKRGASGIWVLCNVSYAGRRAQKHPSAGWRAMAFSFGLPGTLLSYLVVSEGLEPSLRHRPASMPTTA